MGGGPAADGDALKVLLTTDTVGGVFSHVTALARGLSARGVELAIATFGRAPTPEQRLELGSIANARVFESAYALEWMDEPWADVDAAGDWLCALAREFRPHVVHLNGYCHAALPLAAPVLVGAHSCVLSWWRAVFGEAAPARYAEYRRRVKAGLDAAARVVAPSHSMLLSLRELYAPRAPLSVIENGADPREFRTGPKEPLFLAAGRFWDRAKNLSVLEGVAERLPWQLCVAGPTDAPATSSASHLVRLGSLPRSEMTAWLARASVFVHPARYEPFGLAVLEAALSGCALVLGSIPSLRELWGDAAVYVDPDDGAELAAACRRLALDADARELMAERSRERARQFGLEVMTQRYLRAYGELVSPSSARVRASAFTRAAGDPAPLHLAAGRR
jgi:glycosyltransferase involved in cell wall biosynthesis